MVPMQDPAEIKLAFPQLLMETEAVSYTTISLSHESYCVLIFLYKVLYLGKIYVHVSALSCIFQ